LKYLINNFFEEWGIKLNGEVEWVGEDRSDKGKIVVVDNKVKVFEVEETYKEVE
jgi:predicted NUDIX family NTP pyrophosphohydrolase